MLIMIATKHRFVITADNAITIPYVHTSYKILNCAHFVKYGKTYGKERVRVVNVAFRSNKKIKKMGSRFINV